MPSFHLSYGNSSSENFLNLNENDLKGKLWINYIKWCVCQFRPEFLLLLHIIPLWLWSCILWVLNHLFIYSTIQCTIYTQRYHHIQNKWRCTQKEYISFFQTSRGSDSILKCCRMGSRVDSRSQCCRILDHVQRPRVVHRPCRSTQARNTPRLPSSRPWPAQSKNWGLEPSSVELSIFPI